MTDKLMCPHCCQMTTVTQQDPGCQFWGVILGGDQLDFDLQDTSSDGNCVFVCDNCNEELTDDEEELITLFQNSRLMAQAKPEEESDYGRNPLTKTSETIQ